MIYATTSDVVSKLGCNFFCTSLSCEASNNAQYQGLLGEDKIVWKKGCTRCPGMLSIEAVETGSPMRSVVKQMLINASGEGSDSTILWRVLKDFVTVTKDILNAKSTEAIESSVKAGPQPFVFLGYLGGVWLKHISPTSVSGAAISRTTVEYSEKGILFNLDGIFLGIFDSTNADQLYAAAHVIDREVKRQQRRLLEDSDEVCDGMNVSVSGLIEYLDRMLFEIGNPLSEIQIIARILAYKYLRNEQDDRSEGLLRKAISILWLFKDGCCELESVENLRAHNGNKLSMQ